MLTIRPQPASSMPGSAARMQCRVPSRLTAIMLRHNSRAIVRNAAELAWPALLTRMSMAPARSRASANAWDTAPESLTSAFTKSGPSSAPLELRASTVTRAGLDQTSQLLAGKHALVTGGSRGIGAAVTRALLTLGARVTVLARNSSGAEDGPDFVKADVSDSGAVSQAFADARERAGAIDILVNSAGQASSAAFLTMA